MGGDGRRPLLFLDVDGPLLPFGAVEGVVVRGPGGTGTEAGVGRPADRESADAEGNPLLAGLNPALGPRLLALPCDLVWATSWENEANEEIGPRLGLPELPVVMWPEGYDAYVPNGLYWKTPALVAWAAGRPFVWIDDEITDVDQAWVAEHHPGRGVLYRVDPVRGLTAADFPALEAALREVA